MTFFRVTHNCVVAEATDPSIKLVAFKIEEVCDMEAPGTTGHIDFCTPLNTRIMVDEFESQNLLERNAREPGESHLHRIAALVGKI